MTSKLTVLIFLLSCLNILSAQTLITGLISENRTLTPANNPIRIQKAAVQQGVTLRFEGACQVTIVDKLELAGKFQIVGNQSTYASLTGTIRYSGNTSDIDLAFVQLKNATLETYSIMNIRNCTILNSKLNYLHPKGHLSIEECVLKNTKLEADDGDDKAQLEIKKNTFSDCQLDLQGHSLIENNQFVETASGQAENKLKFWSRGFHIIGNSFKNYKNTALHLAFEREYSKANLSHNIFENNGIHLIVERGHEYGSAPLLTTEGNQFLKYRQYAIKMAIGGSNNVNPFIPLTISSTFGDKKTPEALAKAIYDFDDDFHLRIKIQVDTTNALGASTPPVSASQNAREQAIEDAKTQAAEAQQQAIEDAKTQVADAQQQTQQTVITTKPKPFLLFFKNIGYAFGDLPWTLKLVVFSWFWVFFERRGWGFLQKITIPNLYAHLLKHMFTILLLIGSLWVFVLTFGVNPRFSDTLGQIPFGVWFPVLMAGFMFIVFKMSVSKSSIDWMSSRPNSTTNNNNNSSSNSSKKETIKKAIKNGLIDVIEWADNTNDTVVWKFPNNNLPIKNGAKLVVRESQIAILVNGGLFGDHYLSGTHNLTTSNMPILTKLSNWIYGFKNPFKVDIYYISTRQFVNIIWKTENPFIVKDAEFGTIRLQASGKFALRVIDAQRFLTELHGTKSEMRIAEVVTQLKTAIATKFADTLAESKISVSDLAANYLELGERLLPLLKDDFEDYGLEITRFYLENITLPPPANAN